MNRWALMLAEAPPTLQRLIARHQRISLPRGCSAAVRLARLRAALCHARTVRERFFALPPQAQAALHELRAAPRGLAPDDLTARFGPLRPWSQIAADSAPRSLSEQLVLLGLLLPCPTSHRHPARFLLPPEVRAWLPRPLSLPDHGPAPAPTLPLALRAARRVLLTLAERPLPLRADGTPRVASLRLLAARLALPELDGTALCRWLWPLLTDQGLLAPHGATAALAPAGQRFLARPGHEQLALLRDAWVRTPHPDRWLCELGVVLRGLDWPLLRRRLLAWADALPTGRLLDPATLHAALASALGPLADAQTHPFRHTPPERTPWQPKSAAAVWQAALRGPLAWLGLVAWAGDQEPATSDTPAPRWVFHPPDAALERISEANEPWQYATLGEVQVPQRGLDGAVLGLLPFARVVAADATAITYRISRRSLAEAARAGQALSALRSLLQRRAGPLPDAWETLLGDSAPAVQIVHAAVATSADPAVLARAARSRSVRRYLGARLAPGIALVEPGQAAGLVRTLQRQDLAVAVRGDPQQATPAELTPAECATLLAVCAGYRRLAPPEALPPAVGALEERLRAALPRTLAAAEAASPRPLPAPGRSEQAHSLPPEAGVVPDTAAREAPAQAQEDKATPIDAALETCAHPTGYLAPLRAAIAHQRLVSIRYVAPCGPPSERTVRPLSLEHHGERWYLHAYCTQAQAERLFRLDRIAALAPVGQRPARTVPPQRTPVPPVAPRRSTRQSAAPDTGFFPSPSPPPPGSPLVRVWLADDPPTLTPAPEQSRTKDIS